MSKRWKVRSSDSQQVSFLESTANVPALIAHLLACRGITELEEVREFLEPKLLHLRPPQELPGCSAAARIILDAIHANKKITVYGDYDVDGMTGTAILRQAIKFLRGDVTYFVPSRLDEGYGLNHDAIRNLAEEGTKLLITVDCGISSIEEAKTAREVGIELIITDHHTPGMSLPEASAIVHPKLGDYPFTELSGAMVAFKVAWALGQLACGEQKVSPQFREFLLQAAGLAAMGTVADVVPLIDENRALVHFGLETAIPNHAPLGLRELMRIANVKPGTKLTSETIGFQLAPRLNAAGRLGQARLGVELLIIEKDDSPNKSNLVDERRDERVDNLVDERVKELAQYVNGLNETRQKVERTIQKEATRQIVEKFDESDPAFVLASDDWHPGVIGIVAGRLAEKFHRPVIMISLDKMGLKPATGSARGIPGFNLYTALEACCEHLDRFGGHASAAGLGIGSKNGKSVDENVILFREAFCEYALKEITDEMRTAEVLIDAEAPLGIFSLKLVAQIEGLAPFGSANRRPIFCSRAVYLSEQPKKMGAESRHFSAVFEQDGIAFRTVSFGNGSWVDKMEQHGAGPFDIAFHVVTNTFAGKSKVELQLIDWKYADLAK